MKPVFVSVGHRMSLDNATARVLALTPRYRLPETTRTADRLCRDGPGRRPLTASRHRAPRRVATGRRSRTRHHMPERQSRPGPTTAPGSSLTADPTSGRTAR